MREEESKRMVEGGGGLDKGVTNPIVYLTGRRKGEKEEGSKWRKERGGRRGKEKEREGWGRKR